MGARLAVFTLADWSLEVLRAWADAEGHELALLVTQPPTARAGLRDLSAVGSETITLVVADVAGCRGMLAELDIELGVVFTFRRVPDAVAAIPPHGLVNLHPSLLPAYRGPNGYRSLYAGEPRIGATLHRLTAEFDAGPILAQASEPTPDDIEPTSARELLARCATEVLRTGVPRALSGAAGEPQDDADVSPAPLFTPEEQNLSLDMPTHQLLCRFSALALAGRPPSIVLEGESHPLQAVRRLPGLAAPRPGLIALSGRRAVAATADGAVDLALGRLPF